MKKSGKKDKVIVFVGKIKRDVRFRARLSPTAKLKRMDPGPLMEKRCVLIRAQTPGRTC